MTPAKRLMDLTIALIFGVLFLPLGLGIAVVILLRDGRPILYRSERMKTATQGFTLLKFRTMRLDPADAGVTGGDKSDRITRTGRWLRAHRLDELPQLWNVLRGDISLVGPRPPLRLYVEAEPALYSAVLRSRPGLTGLATLVYHRHESRILARCQTPEETHETYLRRCVPAKARLDLIYCDNRNVCLDLVLLWRTLRAIL
ncbi:MULTISPECIES: sugar transferase [unclassified Meridianimarinicoccus]|uniref:sugar transferase n=1 Tax=unclassified Meridianimarinicoccus TaxID=2923344 RepID=UPI001868A3F2|nr:sugar transferase [Fluviibacterium sp. MJW13]